MKALLIDDSSDVIKFFKRALKGIREIVFAECHSVEEALEAIKKEDPLIIFLDNSLCGGNEGLEIADRVSGKIIYSITGSTDEQVLNEYTRRKIEVIGKVDYERIIKILSSLESR